MDDFLYSLTEEFEKNTNDEVAAGQKAYMKNKFEFYGIKSPLRRQVQKPFLVKKHLPSKERMIDMVKILWKRKQREYQYFAQELLEKYINRFEVKDIDLIEYMIIRKSWWDTVDFIATKLAGAYFKKFPEQRDSIIGRWLDSGNIWLQRSAILFQLNYKNDLDTQLLSRIINSLTGSEEFFINKAIGWILRQYGKTNPAWVVDFVNNTPLDKLSRREALRLIIN